MGSLKVGGDCLDTAAAVETLGQLLGDRLGLALPEVSQGRVVPATNDSLDVMRFTESIQIMISPSPVNMARPFGLQERVWILVTWRDGRRERIGEDYPPWTSMTEIRDGWVSWETDGSEVRYDVTWLGEPERSRLWPQVGIVDDVGAYM